MQVNRSYRQTRKPRPIKDLKCVRYFQAKIGWFIGTNDSYWLEHNWIVLVGLGLLDCLCSIVSYYAADRSSFLFNFVLCKITFSRAYNS